jgi:hypothetical protein
MSEGVKGRAWGINRANFDRNLAVVIGIDRYEKLSIRNPAQRSAMQVRSPIYLNRNMSTNSRMKSQK